MATSNKNIKSWEDSFKTQEQLASEMISKFSYKVNEGLAWRTVTEDGDTFRRLSYMVKHQEKLATSYEELDAIYQRMANDVDGLTDAELEALNANKNLLDAQKGYIDDLNSFADSLLSKTFTANTNYAQSMALLNTALSGFATSTDKSQSSSDIQTYANNAITYIGKNSASLSDEKYKTALIANSIKNTAMINDTGSFKTVEDKLEEMKVAIVAELSDIKTNTEREYA